VLSTPPTTDVVNNSPQASLGKDSFLKLLVTQMQDQDPTSPTDSSTFMSQLAQFSSLEQMTNMSDTMTSISNTSSVTQGVDLLGHNIEWTRADGTTGSGVAQSISLASGSVVISVGAEQVDPSEITGVGQASADSTSDTSTGAGTTSGTGTTSGSGTQSTTPTS
jgi:flagellar basal-body rod modification protein FlgD